MGTCDSDFEDQDVVNQEKVSQREVIVETEQSEHGKLPKLGSFESMCEIDQNDQKLLSSTKKSPKVLETLMSSAEFTSLIEKQQ